MDDEKTGLKTFGNSAVNLDRLLCVTLEGEIAGSNKLALLTFDARDSFRTVSIPYEDGEALLGYLNSAGKPVVGTQANTSEVNTQTSAM